MSSQNVSPEKVKTYVKLLQNPYASLSEFVEEKASEVTLEQRRRYYRELQNPHAYDAVFGESADDAQSEKIESGSKPLAPLGISRISKRDFQDGCRRIFSQYIPPEEGRVLRPHYRDFITRNQDSPPELRFQILEGLRKYDISASGNFNPHFNRERELLTTRKLQQIETAAQAHRPSQ